MGRNALTRLEIPGLCEECRNDCTIKAPKGAGLRCPNYKKIPASQRKITAAYGEGQNKVKQERIMKNETV